MKTYKKKTVKTIDQVYCDSCGSNCTKDQLGYEYGVLEASWGYSSKQDGTNYEIHLCEICFMEVVDFLKKKRKRVLGCFNYPHKEDPLEGKSYFPS